MGFEPTDAFTSQHFQCCAFNRSATSPKITDKLYHIIYLLSIPTGYIKKQSYADAYDCFQIKIYFFLFAFLSCAAAALAFISDSLQAAQKVLAIKIDVYAPAIIPTIRGSEKSFIVDTPKI